MINELWVYTRLLNEKKRKRDKESEEKEVKRPTSGAKADSTHEHNTSKRKKEKQEIEDPKELNDLSVAEMFKKIMQRMDEAEKERKEEYNMLTNEIGSIRNEMQTALMVQEKKMEKKVNNKIAIAESRIEAKITELENRMEKWKGKDNTQNTQNEIYTKVQSMEWKLELQEREDRRKNVIIRGLEMG